MIYYALLSFFVVEYVRPGAYVPGLDALHLNSLVPLTCIIGTLVMKTPVSSGEFFAEWNTKIMGALLGLLVVSTLFATVTMYAYSVMTTVFAYILIYWILVRQVGDVRRLKGVFITLTAAHIIIAALNPAVFSPPANTRVGINSGSFLGDGNDFSLSVNICIPLCLFLMAESKKKILQAPLGRRAAYAGALRHSHPVARGNSRARGGRAVLLVEEPEEAADCGAFRARGRDCPGVGTSVLLRSNGDDF